LCDVARKEFEANNVGFTSDKYRVDVLKKEFGVRDAAKITTTEFKEFFDSQDWKRGTFRRCKTTLMGIYRVGNERGLVDVNPAKSLKVPKRQMDDDSDSDERTRYLNQFTPLATEVEYLKPCTTEEERLRAVIEHDYPEYLETFELALNTGMRRKEQFTRANDWKRVTSDGNQIFVPASKNGESRYIPLNSAARNALERMKARRIADGPTPITMTGPIFATSDGTPLQGARHWFEDAVKKAGIEHIRWHDLRHSFASRLAMAGVDLRTLAALMGHKKIQMTMRYSHLSPQHNLNAVELIVDITTTKNVAPLALP
jgi:site-specific recombinase XerD